MIQGCRTLTVSDSLLACNNVNLSLATISVMRWNKYNLFLTEKSRYWQGDRESLL